MIRLIASDLDGTLLWNHNAIHPDNLAAIRDAMARGIRFAVASGRGPDSCGRLLTAHGFHEALIIGVNGCKVVERPFGPVLESHHFIEGAAEAVLDILARHGLEACLYAEDMIVYTSEESLTYHEGMSARQAEEWNRTNATRKLFGDKAVSEALRARPMKVFCTRNPGQEAAHERARAACAALPGVEMTSSWIDNFEVMPKGVNKGSALCSLAGRLGIRRQEVMAFGDCDNDLPMLSWAGVGVAMGNAVSSVKEGAAYRTGTNAEGGVAQGIRRWALA